MPPTDSVFATPAGSRKRIHTLTFDDPSLALKAVHRLREEGFEVEDVHTPYAVHGMDEALGLPETRLGMATLTGGLVGCGLAFAFQIWTHAIDWPLFIGGKSPLALRAGTRQLRADDPLRGPGNRRIAPREAPAFPGLLTEPASQPGPAVTDNRFVVLIVERDGGFRLPRLSELSRELGALELVEGWRVL